MSIPDLKGCPVLVTGGAGFIGSHLVDALVAHGARVRVLDNFLTGQRANLHEMLGKIDLVEGDIRDLQTCRMAASGRTFLFHQAALGSVPRSIEDPATTIAINVQGCANILSAARDAGVRRVVYASSSSVYGDSVALPKREGEEGAPLSPYALSKRMNEELAATFHRCFGLEVVGLRYFNVYGPRQDPGGPYAAVIPRFFSACVEGNKPVVFGDGEQSRDFTFVRDAVIANLLAAGALREASGRVFNVATGRRTAIKELARLVRGVVGSGKDTCFEAARFGDVPHSQADLTLARSVLGYEPATTLLDGLRETFTYYAHKS